MLHPENEPRVPTSSSACRTCAGPVIAATDYMNALPTRSARSCRSRITPCSAPTASAAAIRAKALREFLRSRSPLRRGRRAEGAGRPGSAAASKVTEAIANYGIDPEKPTRPPFEVARFAGVRRCCSIRSTSVDSAVHSRSPHASLLTPLIPHPIASHRSPSPDIGDFKDVPVIEVLVKPGDTSSARIR